MQTKTNKLAHVPANAHLRLHQEVEGIIHLFMTHHLWVQSLVTFFLEFLG